ncbi:hypothetical protein Pres01_48270 [Metapseudomonas resinovorans]|uniref:hypothetical protein n=1 Tax=Metapseudomonas resinovorans TaxID=53412 RepID=UPI0009850EA0|nr:hypothetical protein [Pseudomonas resinovorans]GLZ88776.1 hypothetical protein Pres01_48270 [Pseudomonas resinovorans]
MYLETAEQDALYLIMKSLWGRYADIFSSRTHMFNEMTVDVVQQAIESNRACNSEMLSLLSGLAAGAAIGAHRKWLREALGDVAGKLSNGTMRLNGQACMVTTFAVYRSEIELTFY